MSYFLADPELRSSFEDLYVECPECEGSGKRSSSSSENSGDECTFCHGHRKISSSDPRIYPANGKFVLTMISGLTLIATGPGYFWVYITFATAFVIVAVNWIQNKVNLKNLRQ